MRRLRASSNASAAAAVVLLAVLGCCCSAVAATLYTAVASGTLSTPAVWNPIGTPTTGDSISIPSGYEITATTATVGVVDFQTVTIADGATFIVSTAQATLKVRSLRMLGSTSNFMYVLCHAMRCGCDAATLC